MYQSQSNGLAELVVADWFHFFGLHEFLVGDITINKQDPNCPKEDRPPPLPFVHPMIEAVVVSELIRNVDTSHSVVVVIVD